MTQKSTIHEMYADLLKCYGSRIDNVLATRPPRRWASAVICCWCEMQAWYDPAFDEDRITRHFKRFAARTIKCPLAKARRREPKLRIPLHIRISKPPDFCKHRFLQACYWNSIKGDLREC